MNLLDFLNSCRIGRPRRAVVMHEPQPRWQEAADRLISDMRAVLPESLSLEHVGSTSLGDIASKPVLDILLTFPSGIDISGIISALESLGFTNKGDRVGAMRGENDPDRHYFVLYDRDKTVDYAHIHMLPASHPKAIEMVRFRDILRNDRELRAKYESLKLDLARQDLAHGDFAMAKTDFVTDTLR